MDCTILFKVWKQKRIPLKWSTAITTPVIKEKKKEIEVIVRITDALVF
jgi:hypothetical protein